MVKPEEFAKRLQALVDKGAVQEASELCAEAVAKRPDSPETWRLCGVVALRAGDVAKAEASFRETVRLVPENPIAHSSLASALLRSGKLLEARKELELSLSLDPKRERDVDSLVSLLLKAGELEAARSVLLRSLPLGVKCPGACALMAAAEMDAGNSSEASKLFILAAHWSPKVFFAIENCAMTLMRKNAFAQAESILAPVAAAFPKQTEVKINLCVCLMQRGAFEEAAKIFEELKKEVPEEVPFLINYGTFLYKTGRLEDSIAVFKKSLSLLPEDYHAGLALSLSLLKLGRLEEAWPYWDCRLKQPNFAKLSKCPLPLWTPDAPASAKILVRCEQGFGDSLFFGRFLEPLRRRCSKLVFLCRPELFELFKSVKGIDELLPLDGDELSTRGCDFKLPLASLPKFFVHSLEDIPVLASPLVIPPKARYQKWRDFVKAKGGTRNIGLCWSGSQENLPGRMRSIPVDELAPLFEVKGVTWFSLQADSEERRLTAPVVRTAEHIGDFADTAALIANLDMVVSIDTATAHLAGALMKPCSVLLCAEADWRWFSGREDSPWYPTLRLFRQGHWGNWKEPLGRIAALIGS